MGLKFDLGDEGVISGTFNENSQANGSSLQMAAAPSSPQPVSPSQLLNGRLIPATAENARKIGLG